MTKLNDLYQQIIIDHNQHPHNFRVLEHPNYNKEGYNPLCGDKITLYVTTKDNIITDISFQGVGCAISTASTSLMTDAVKGKTTEETLELFTEFQKLITTGKIHQAEKLGKLAVLAGIFEFPMRVKCATLGWHTLKAILTKNPNTVSTE